MFAFLVSPLGRYVALAVILLGCNAYSYLKGRSDANAHCRTAALERALATAQADLAITQQAAQRDRDAIDRLTADTEASNARLAEYERTLQGRDPCTLSPDDVDRLRNLGGPR